MAENRAVWGVEIGQSALKAIKLQYAESSDQVVAVAFDYVPFPKILSQPDAIPEELIPQAVDTFLSRNDVQNDLIAISVPGHSALVRFIQLPPVESSKVSEIVKYEARQQIPFALDEVIWDYQPLGSGIEESGFMLDAEVGLFAMKRDQVMQQMRPFTNAKLEVELVQIAPLALYNVLCFDELGIRPNMDSGDIEEHTIVLDMGCDNTTLLVSNGTKIWVRNVPVGGNHFTRALTKDMKLSFAKAEHLKCNATKSPDPRAVFQALRPVFNDFVSEIQRSIGYFSSVNRQAKIAKVVGFGNGFKLAGLQKFLQQNLQYDVERPDTFNGLSGDAVLNTPLFQENLLGFAVPYGLALQTLGMSRIQTSLLPPEIAVARQVRKKKPWAVATAALLLTSTAIAMGANGLSYSSVNTEQWAGVEKEAGDFKKQVDTLRQNYDKEKATFTKIREQANYLVEGRRNNQWLEVYKAINECLPRDENDEAETLELEHRNRISITTITCQHRADVKTWFDQLSPDQLANMNPDEKATPPSGEGYIFYLQGFHYHREEDPETWDILYVINNFLKTGLWQWTVETEDGSQQDVRRLGISHATAMKNGNPYQFTYDPRGPLLALGTEEPESRIQGAAGNGFGRSGFRPQAGGFRRGGRGKGKGDAGGGGGALPGIFQPSADNENLKTVEKTEFTVTFVWKPTDVRYDEGEAPPADAAPAAGFGSLKK
ncbi:MAG: type IV pilus assembly protein PilM [Planctomycetaceae bacterium]|nr:type IV pilus assembly protein PilM [Planctomycetaceae bacterium]